MKKQQWRWMLTVICVLAAGICYSCSRQEYGFLQTGEEQMVLSMELSTEESAENCEESTRTVAEEESLCYVHICGEVAVPGVYEMKPGDRIFQVLELAGGYTEDAVEEYLNLAQEVEDGMKLVVPSETEWTDGTDREQKLNLNTATAAELMQLKGIGEVRAADIVAYRDKHGPFSRIEDIMKVPGIKDAAFQKIKDDITV